ncbi:glycosyltransferase family 92 protein [Amaricoccus tamworthensis]|uniref:glycosyltransferase family 92 protein n=1 Tax=Amaricoccus tamworthensis TaxID=57002 RepID=UPI003C7C3C93
MLWKLPIFGKISKIGITPPKPAGDRSGLTITAIVKNEGRYIGEWAHFHNRAGVSRFVIYDNGCSDETMSILRDVLPSEKLVTVPWNQSFTDARMGREIHNQVLAYAHAARNFGSTCRWMAFIDVDEFLIPKSALNLNDALQHLRDVRSISLPWHMFGRSGHMKRPAGGVLRNYRMRASDPMSDLRGVRAFKCIVDPCHLTGVRVHSMEVDGSDDTCNDQGKCFSAEDREKPKFYSAHDIQLNHYYTRSEEELAAKIGRGPNLLAKTSEYERKVRRTVANIEKNQVEDTAALDYFARIGWE